MKQKKIFPGRRLCRLGVISCLVFLLVTNVISTGEPVRDVYQEDTDGLVLWNKLGSNEEVLNSEVGPNLSFYTGGYWPDVQGDREYVSGYDGDSVTLKGSYGVFDRIHNIVFENLNYYLDPEKGSIELWYYCTEVPTLWSHSPHRLFGGSYGLRSGMAFQAYAPENGDPPNVIIYLAFGGTGCYTYYNMSNIPINEWVHLAASWDRNGIEGSADSIRLYVNNVLVASTIQNNWGTTVGYREDICGGNGHNIIGKYKMDELKIWNYAKTNFFDIPAAIDIDPDKINLASKGKWVTGYIEFEGIHSLEDIEPDTIAISKINNIPIAPLFREGPANIGDHDLDNIPDLMVKFDRQELIDHFNNMNAGDEDEMSLTVTGKLSGGESFMVGCTLTVIKKGV